jgi:hypothetical protein
MVIDCLVIVGEILAAHIQHLTASCSPPCPSSDLGEGVELSMSILGAWG